MLLRILSGILLINNISALNSVWHWECHRGYCEKVKITHESEELLSLAECRLKCSEYSAIWPQPTGVFDSSSELVTVNPAKIQVIVKDSAVDLIDKAAIILKEGLLSHVEKFKIPGLSRMKINVFTFLADPKITKLTIDTDESYTLKIDVVDDEVLVNITANNFFGARHGLETLGQLIVFDDLRNLYKMPKSLSMEDEPAFPHRGILIDTSRNYISVDTIKRTIDGMAASKLNTFHWHMTDSHSFPYESKSLPDLSKYGAYSPKKVYTSEMISDILEYAKVRGVKIIPEFDAPAHVGEGWQNTNFVTCFKAQPWLENCLEPPCGQFDPTIPELYDALEALYGDLIEQFQPDMFHMGGDEVHFGCWNNTESIIRWMTDHGMDISEKNFIELWDLFQKQAYEKLQNKNEKKIPVILWTSMLTQKEYIHKLPNDKYIIQVWTNKNDKQIEELLERGYKIIMSNYDALYLDCGFANWIDSGNNWCSPYIGWQKIYDNSPAIIAGERKKQVLGAEATMWTETVDDNGIDSRIWPRAAAMAEQLWSEPINGWRRAEQRFLVHRERLVSRGIGADAVEPEWCRQNEEECPVSKTFHSILIRDYVPPSNTV